MKASIETDSTLLRPFLLSDANDLYAYASTPKIGPMAGWQPHESVQDSKNIIKMFIEEDDVWAIVLKSTGKVIGSVELHKSRIQDIDYDFELGYVLSEEFCGQGIIPECAEAVLNYAFMKCGAKTVICCHFPFNFQSKRVIEKLGFTYLIKVEKSRHRYDGEVLDEEIYSLFKTDFLKKRTLQ